MNLTFERLREVLSYEPDTGLFRWKIRNGPRIKVGDIAGSKDRKGYIRIQVDRKIYGANRLAWLYTYGELSDMQIDHINNIKDDNRVNNLRLATNRQNRQNSSGWSKSVSGRKGVYPSPGTNRWQAIIGLPSGIQRLGVFETKEEAAEAYNIAAKANFGEFARMSI